MKRYLIFCLALLAFLLPVAQIAQAATNDFTNKIAGMNKVTGLRVNSENGKVRIVVDTTQTSEYRSFSLSNPDRVAVDIQNAWIAKDVVRTIDVRNSSYVSQVRISQYNETTVRIVVDSHVFRNQLNFFPLAADEKNKRSARLVLDFGEVNTPPKQVEKNLETVQKQIEAEHSGADPDPTGTIDFEIIDPPISGAGAAPIEKTGSHTPGLAGKTIVIDPGHGGSDSGAIGRGGTQEKDITLAISKYLESYFDEAGAKVIMTRSTDVDVSHANATDREELDARSEVGNRNQADLFLSVHIDSFSSSDAQGTTVYIHDDTRLGKCLHDELVRRLDRPDRGVKFANFYVLKHTTMPAALVEVMFISNPEEEALLTTKEVQMQAARGIFEGTRIYFS